LESIYQRFNNNQQNGTGLGLPICKELTEQMGGTIEVNSEVGKGTTVWISIPCTASAIERKNEII
jgi:signal transduction histidine kinase